MCKLTYLDVCNCVVCTVFVAFKLIEYEHFTLFWTIGGHFLTEDDIPALAGLLNKSLYREMALSMRKRSHIFLS